MALRKRPITAGIAALLFSSYLSALGLGEIKLNSALNEPLDAEIPLVNLGRLSQAELIVGLAGSEDFSVAGVSRELILSSLVFELDFSAPKSPLLRVTSKKPIREPYLDFLVDIQWPAGRLLREYTLLLDLPVYAGGERAKKKADTSARRPSGQVTQGREYRADTGSRSQVSASGGEYVVESGDTLWRIASNLPSDASVHQRMAAIHQLNPEAFINDDINLIRQGAVLRLPDMGSADIGTLGTSRGSRDSEAYKPLVSGASRSSSSSESVAEPSGKLRLSASDADGAQDSSALGAGREGGGSLRGELNNIQEELDRTRRENSELKQRLSSLEDQISTMQRLVEIEDDELRAAQIAGLQNSELAATEDKLPSAGDLIDEPIEDRAGSEDEVTTPAWAMLPSAKNDSPVSEDISSTPQVEIAEDENSSVAALMETDAEAVDASAVFEDSAAVETQSTPTSSAMKMDLKKEEGWFKTMSSYLLYLLGALVVAIGAGAFYLRRKGQNSGYQDFTPKPATRYTPPPPPVREEPAEVAPTPAAVATGMDDLDLNEEDDLFAPSKKPVEAEPGTTLNEQKLSQTADDLELDLAEFDLGEMAEEETNEASESTSVSSSELNLDDEFDFLGDVDEGDTQLELAQAYIDMGDNSGAREILLEVAESGDDAQREKARTLLEQLG